MEILGITWSSKEPSPKSDTLSAIFRRKKYKQGPTIDPRLEERNNTRFRENRLQDQLFTHSFFEPFHDLQRRRKDGTKG